MTWPITGIRWPFHTRHVMNDRLTTAPQRGDADGNRPCQAERCPQPPSLLPWTVDLGSVTLVLWLCHGYGETVTGERTSADAGGEAA